MRLFRDTGGVCFFFYMARVKEKVLRDALDVRRSQPSVLLQTDQVISGERKCLPPPAEKKVVSSHTANSRSVYNGLTL